MFGGMTYKKKVWLLGIGTVVLVILVYRMGIRKTVEQKRFCRELEEKIELVSYAPKEIVRLQEQLDAMNSYFGEDTTGYPDLRTMLIEVTGSYCDRKGINVKEIPEPVYEVKEDMHIEINQVVLEGKFHELVKYLYFIEMEEKLGKVASVRFFVEKDVRSKVERLRMKVVVKGVGSR